MSDNKNEDLYEHITEFDFMMAAMSVYCMTSMDKEQFWNIINHVQDGYEFDVAIEAQEMLNDLTDNHYEMKRHFDSM